MAVYANTSGSDVLYSGLIYGRLPGQKKNWVLFYLTVSTTQLHIFEGLEDFSQPRKHIRSLGIGSDDMIGEEKGKKKEYKFFVKRADGRYIFKCDAPGQRENWIAQLQRLVNKTKTLPNRGMSFSAKDQPLSPIPPLHDQPGSGFSSNVSIASDDSGIGASREGEIRRGKSRSGTLSLPASGDGSFLRPKGPLSPKRQSDGGKFNVRYVVQVEEEGSLSRGKWLSIPNYPLSPIRPLHDQSGRDFSSNVSIASDDSGIGASREGEIYRGKSRSGTSSLPASGDSSFLRPKGPLFPKSQSDGGKFNARDVVQVEEEGNPEELENYKWFWGHMNRKDCEEQLRAEGNVGNFVIRVNATGNYIMSFWRSDGIHHHKISQYDNMFRFERTHVSADGCSLVDLLDTYMKNCSDKSIKPFGGQLFLQYDEPWNLPPLDMEKLGQRLREQKGRKEHHHSPKPSPKPDGQESAQRQPRAKDRYDVVEDFKQPKKRPPSNQVPPSEVSPRRGSGQDEQQLPLGGTKKLPQPPVKDKPSVAPPPQENLKKADSLGRFKALPPTPPVKEQTRQASVEEDTSPRLGYTLPGASEIRRSTQQNLASSAKASPTPEYANLSAMTSRSKPPNPPKSPPYENAELWVGSPTPQNPPKSPPYENAELWVGSPTPQNPPKSPPYENAELWVGSPTQSSPKVRSLDRSAQSISHGGGPNSAASPAAHGTNGEPVNFYDGIYQNVNAPPPPRRKKKKEFESMQEFAPPTAEGFDPSVMRSAASSKTLPSRGKSFFARSQSLPSISPLHDQPGRGFNSRVSVASDGSGIGASSEGEIRCGKSRSRTSSLPVSGDGSFLRPLGRLKQSDGGNLNMSPKSQSNGGKFNVRDVVQVEEEGNPEELENYKWFWGHMNRKDCEEQLRAEGNVGNFVIRVDATGHYIMSLWRSDGILHYKIIQYGNMFHFEGTHVSADGCSLVDLLDTYMKNCSDKSIKPFGGQLFLQYDEPWNPLRKTCELCGIPVASSDDLQLHYLTSCPGYIKAEEPPKRKEMVNVKPKVLGIGTHKESEEQIQAGPKESRDTVRDTVVGVPYREAGSQLQHSSIEQPCHKTYQETEVPHLHVSDVKKQEHLTRSEIKLFPPECTFNVLETTVHGIKEKQTIEYSGCKLHIPALAIPESEECSFTIATCMSEAFVLPPHTTLVSSVYFIKSSRESPFQQPVTIELEHCCDLDKHTASELVFATASSSTEQRPFVFATNELGRVLPGSPFGQLSTYTLSFFTILWDKIRSIWYSPFLRYSAHVFYRNQGRTVWKVILVITKNLQTCRKAVKELYTDVKELTSFEIHLDPECESVDVDGLESCGIATNDGCWKISPTYSPQIKRSEIDSFESGTYSPAKCELFVRWLKEDVQPRPLEYTVHLKGAEPKYFNIVLDPNQQELPVGRIDTAESCGICPDAYTEINEGDSFGVSVYLLDLERDHIYNLGLALGLSQRKVKAMLDESTTFLDDVLSAWIRREDYVVKKHGNPSWGTLVEALKHRRLNQNGIAKQIVQDKPWQKCKSLSPTQTWSDDEDEGDSFEVSSYLLDLERDHIYNLGVALGLSQRKVKAMLDESTTFLDDVLSAWIRREDYVVKKHGNPSWGTLVEALKHRRLNQNGIAKQIVQDKPWQKCKSLSPTQTWSDDEGLYSYM